MLGSRCWGACVGVDVGEYVLGSRYRSRCWGVGVGGRCWGVGVAGRCWGVGVRE